jgi:hypothetical protein
MRATAKITVMACAAAMFLSAALASGADLNAIVEDAVRGTRNDAQRASNLRDAARRVEEDTPVKIALLELAVDYGLRTLSYPDAREAVNDSLDLLIEEAPERKDVWDARRVEMYRRWFRLAWDQGQKMTAGEKLVGLLAAIGAECEQRGEWSGAANAYLEAHGIATAARLKEADETRGRYLRAGHCSRVSRKADALVGALIRNAKDSAARMQLLTLLVVELDRPGEAVRYLDDNVPAAWRELVPLAADPVEDLPPATCLKLGGWYERDLRLLAASPVAKVNVLTRIVMYYTRYVLEAEKGDETALALKKTVAMAKVGLKQLEKAAAAPPPPPPKSLKPKTASSKLRPTLLADSSSGKSISHGGPPPKDSKGKSHGPPPPPRPDERENPSNIIRFNGHGYRLIKDRTSWARAKEKCEQMGGHLMCLESEEELAFAKKLSSGRRLWMGARNTGGGRWQWINGLPLPPGEPFWQKGDPTGDRGEDYATMLSGGMKDAQGDNKSVSGYICEWDN